MTREIAVLGAALLDHDWRAETERLRDRFADLLGRCRGRLGDLLVDHRETVRDRLRGASDDDLPEGVVFVEESRVPDELPNRTRVPAEDRGESS